jgi:hypothetical protein
MHKLPDDFKKALASSVNTLSAWEDITPLARNEWICWVISVKQQETRTHHIKRAVEELAQGKRRPCCWMGCVHRTDKPINSTQKFLLAKVSKKKR